MAGHSAAPDDDGVKGRQLVPTTSAGLGQMLVTLRARGASKDLEGADREQLLADAVAGKDVRLVAEALTFIQRDMPNRNMTRFKPGILRRLAKSFVGMPFLRDHRQEDSLARGGTILASELVDVADGEKGFRQTIELSAPWAVEMALRGLLDRFSIGWHSAEGTVCSICEEPMSTFWGFVFSECDHMPGEGYDGTVCQLMFTSAEGVEVSAVTVPAVVGTELEEIRAALAAARAQGREPHRRTSMTRLHTVLGLDEDKPHEELVEAVLKVKGDLDATTLLLGAEREAHTATKTALEEARQLLATIRREEEEIRTSELIEGAVRDGKIRPRLNAEGKREATEVERAIRLMAKTDRAGAEAYVGDLPRILPVGGGLVSERHPAPPAANTILSDAQRHAAKQLGVTEAQYLEQLNTLKGA